MAKLQKEKVGSGSFFQRRCASKRSRFVYLGIDAKRRAPYSAIGIDKFGNEGICRELSESKTEIKPEI